MPTGKDAAARPSRSPKTHPAYAVDADGTRRRLKAFRILIDLAGTEVEIDLLRARPKSANGFRISTFGTRVLVVGPADSNSVDISVEPFRGARLKRT
jgi:hypothetical protein